MVHLPRSVKESSQPSNMDNALRMEGIKMGRMDHVRTLQIPVALRKGAGNGDPRDGLCLMQMVDWFSGSDHTIDHPECASPVLSELAIYLNDAAPTQIDRDMLWPLVWRLIGSRDPALEQGRAEYMVRATAHHLGARVFMGLYRAAFLQAETMEDVRDAILNVLKVPVSTYEMSEDYWAAVAAKSLLTAIEFTEIGNWNKAAVWVGCTTAAMVDWASLSSEMKTMEVWETLHQILIRAIELGAHGEEDYGGVEGGVSMGGNMVPTDMVARADGLIKILSEAGIMVVC